MKFDGKKYIENIVSALKKLVEAMYNIRVRDHEVKYYELDPESIIPLRIAIIKFFGRHNYHEYNYFIHAVVTPTKVELEVEID